MKSFGLRTAGLRIGYVALCGLASFGAFAGPVNINTADASQFALLPRIGAKAAERIVEYRKANGPFKKTTDLMQVKGIGDKSFETLSPYLTLDGKTTLTEKQHGPKRAAKSRPTSSTKAQ